MCLPANPKVRRHFQIGTACLAIALLSQTMNFTFGLAPVPLQFLRGVLIGISIVANLQAARLRQRSTLL